VEQHEKDPHGAHVEKLDGLVQLDTAQERLQILEHAEEDSREEHPPLVLVLQQPRHECFVRGKLQPCKCKARHHARLQRQKRIGHAKLRLISQHVRRVQQQSEQKAVVGLLVKGSLAFCVLRV